MSIKFNDTTTGKGLVQLYELEVGFDTGDVSGNDTLLKRFTVDCNVACDDFLNIAFGPDGTWQVDDSNYTNGDGDYPIIKTNLTSGKRDYVFLEDEYGNMVLDIYKVWVMDPSGVYREVLPVDQFTANSNNSDTDEFSDGRDTAGVPTTYDKLGNAIIFNLVPNYTKAHGVKVAINREAYYFTYEDTDKKPGFPGTLHKWFYLKPALEKARRDTLASHDRIALEVAKLEKQIEKTFRRRQRDVKPRMRANVENNH